mmetsp:Transcript_22394/g.66388  ORF Transcript_22394/g.66388 Transcript_22394/m.66388 type:complete len:249 (-) Transcript_22394:392-1138(-)
MRPPPSISTTSFTTFAPIRTALVPSSYTRPLRLRRACGHRWLVGALRLKLVNPAWVTTSFPWRGHPPRPPPPLERLLRPPPEPSPRGRRPTSPRRKRSSRAGGGTEATTATPRRVPKNRVPTPRPIRPPSRRGCGPSPLGRRLPPTTGRRCPSACGGRVLPTAAAAAEASLGSTNRARVGPRGTGRASSTSCPSTAGSSREASVLRAATAATIEGGAKLNPRPRPITIITTPGSNKIWPPSPTIEIRA